MKQEAAMNRAIRRQAVRTTNQPPRAGLQRCPLCSGDSCLRRTVADALTAINLHAEAITMRAERAGVRRSEISLSAREIAGCIELIWSSLADHMAICPGLEDGVAQTKAVNGRNGSGSCSGTFDS